MEKTISALREQIERTEEDQGGRKVFAAALRDAVVELAHAWLASGQSRSALARRLGLNPATLAWWLHRHGPAASEAAVVRPVHLVEDGAPPRVAAGPRTVRLPSGACIEGLTLDEVLAVVRAL